MNKVQIQENIELAPYTTWKIGGKARYFVAVKSVEELLKALDFARSKLLPYFVLGGGSNILISDAGFDGLVIKMEFFGITFGENEVAAGAGVMMSRLAAEALNNGYSGLEWAIGLPGTVGGAVFGNSNCWGGSTGKSLIWARILNDDKIMEVDEKYFNFSYDYSKLQETKEVLLEGIFKLEKFTGEEMIKARGNLAKVAAERSSRQPLGKKVAGSTFKALVPTPEIIAKFSAAGLDYKQGLRDGFISAGWIIDKALNLKGYEMGNMKISDLHANFFINTGVSTASEAKKLIDFVKKECKNKLDIALEEEIKYVGNFD